MPMAYRKRDSRTLDRVRRRLTGFKSIDPTIDLGDGVSVQAFTDMVNALSQTLAAYNIALADADVLGSQLSDAEKAISVYAEKVLLAVAVKFGKDSPEYGRAGGVRSSLRKRYKRPKRPVEVVLPMG
jgi:hypothetical protein